MQKYLTKQQVSLFKKNGCISPLNMIPKIQASEFRKRFEYAEESRGGKLKGMELHKSYLFLTFLNEIARYPKILDAVEDLIGPDILVFSSSLFIKEPKNEQFISWHQDSTYWHFDPPEILTCWVALTPCHQANGCMKIAIGSHLWGQVDHDERSEENNMLSRNQEISSKLIDKVPTQDIILQPGQVSFHHLFSAHASGPNYSNDRRIGFAIRYMATSVRQKAGPKLTAMLVRGVDNYGYYEPENGPSIDFDPAGLSFHKETVERHRSTNYSTM